MRNLLSPFPGGEVAVQICCRKIGSTSARAKAISDRKSDKNG